MAEVLTSVCPNHPDTPAVARCAVCGKPVCEKCLVIRNGVQYCSAQCASLAESRKGDVGMVMKSKKKVDSARKIRAVVIFIVIVVAAVAGYLFYQRNRNDIHRFVHKAERQVSTGARETKNSIRSGIPKDSSYKRDRENLVK